jgi:DNA-binding SARP family transcriptional activator/RecA/RadA recombinase
VGFWLHLVGACVLERDGVPVALGKRSNALIAYIALEGTTARGTIASLLWNETDEERARASLRQEIYRINQNGEIVQNDRHNVWLSSAVQHDLSDFNTSEGEFAAGLNLDELEFESWLEGARALLRDKRSAFLEAEVRRLSAQNQWREAMLAARRALALDTLSESLHREYIRLAYLADDRTAVRSGIADLRRVLREELGVLPETETSVLIEAIEQGRLPKPKGVGVRKIPMSVLRPPKLAGSRAWQALVSGVTKGKAMFIAGEMGSGKTRLLSELAASRSALGAKVLEMRCRETENSIPFSALIQAVREHALLEKHMGQRSNMPDIWRSELARLVPELRDDGVMYRSFDQSGELLETRARVLESFTQYALALAAPNGMLILDDLHWADQATLEWLSYAVPRLLPFGVAVLVAYRPLEADKALLELCSQLEASGSASRIELEPLGLPELEELLGGIDRRATALAPEMLRVSGGNPLFVVETLKHLLETGQLNESWQLLGDLEPPERIGALLRRRLERMTPLGRRVLGVVALLDSADAQVVANTLRADELEVAEALSEAQQSHMLTEQGAFSHDALRQVALSFLPETVRRALHRRAAQVLESQNAEAGRIAMHYQNASDFRSAAPHMVRAAETALEQLEPRRAMELLSGLELQVLEQSVELRWRVVRAEALFLEKQYFDAEREAQAALLTAKRLGDLLLEHRSSLVLSEACLFQGKFLEAKTLLVPLMPHLSFDHRLRAGSVLGWAELIVGDLPRAIAAFEHTIPWSGEAQLGRALAAWLSGRTREALHAAQIALQASEGFKRLQAQLVLGMVLWTRGQLSDGLTALGAVLASPEAQPHQRVMAFLARAPIYLTRGEFNHALSDLQAAQTALARLPSSSSQQADLDNQLGLLYGLCGDLERSQQHFAQSIAQAELLADEAVHLPRGLQATVLALHQAPMAAEYARLEPPQTAHALAQCYALLGIAESAWAVGQAAKTFEVAEKLHSLALDCEIPEMRAYAQLLIGFAKPDHNALQSALTLAQSIGITLVIARAAQALRRQSVAQAAFELLLEHTPEDLRGFAAKSVAARLLRE